MHNDCTHLYVQPLAKIQCERIRGQCHYEKERERERNRNLLSNGRKQKLWLFTWSSFCFVFVPPADSKGLSNPSEVEALREKVYASLEAYCKQKYPEQPGRYGHKPNHACPQTVVFRMKRATHTHTYLERARVRGKGSSVFTFTTKAVTSTHYRFQNIKFQLHLFQF